MRTLYQLFFFILFSLSLAAQNPDKKLCPDLSSVKVFTTGAQLHHNFKTELKKGFTTLKLVNLPTSLEPNTINITLSNQQVKMHSVSTLVVPNENKTSPRLKLIQDSISLFTDRLKLITSQIEAFRSQQKLLYDVIQNNAKAAAIQDIEKNIDFYSRKFNDIYMRIHEAEMKKAEIDSVTEVLNKRMGIELIRRSSVQTEIDIILYADNDLSTDIDLKYIVNTAGWMSKYDFRISSNSEKIEIRQKADIYNNTGIDWNKIPLVLSIAQPDKLTEVPELSPMDFGRNNRIEDSYQLQKQSEITETGKLDAAVHYKTMVVPEFNAEYMIQVKYRIPSDAKPYTIEINTSNTEARFRYVAVPKIEEQVYLTAMIPNWNSMNFLSGEANIFLDNALVSRTEIVTAPDDTLRLSLGTDSKIKIKRNKVKSETESAMIGNKVKYSFTFEIITQNLNDFAVNITLIDQVPVSTDKDVEVKQQEISGARMAENGLLYWNISLKPGETCSRLISYSIRYPENRKFDYNSSLQPKKRVVLSPAFY